MRKWGSNLISNVRARKSENQNSLKFIFNVFLGITSEQR